MFGQGFASMSAPAKRLEALTIDGKLRHAGHPVLGWQAGNVAVQSDPAGNIKPSKAKSTERIDGIVALVMAIGTHMGESLTPQAMPELSFW
jgi:phage terminase large subunit-like protein